MRVRCDGMALGGAAAPEGLAGDAHGDGAGRADVRGHLRPGREPQAAARDAGALHCPQTHASWTQLRAGNAVIIPFCDDALWCQNQNLV